MCSIVHGQQFDTCSLALGLGIDCLGKKGHDQHREAVLKWIAIPSSACADPEGGGGRGYGPPWKITKI